MSDNQKPGEPQPAPSQRPLPQKKKNSSRALVAAILIVALIGAAVFGTLWWRHSRDYESTDDAYIDVQPQYVSPQVAGRVLRVLVNDYQQVKAGDALVEIDPADYQMRLDQAEAGQAQADAQVEQAKAQELVDEAQLRQAEANVSVAEANATNAARDYARYQNLREQIAGAVSQQQLDTASTQARTMRDQVLVTQKAAEAAKAQLGFAGRRIVAAEAALKSAQAQVAQAKLNLSYTQVKADISGQIANKSVSAGNYLKEGTQIMAVVPDQVYVTANFKETQLDRMRRGQPVEIHADAFPGLNLRGHVDSIQPASGQAFSVLPPQNATGNWVKIVQRVPVKIVFDGAAGDADHRLGPGMSVEVKVTVTGAAH